MSVRRKHPVAVVVVEQHEFLGQGVMVGRKGLWEVAEAGVAVALGQVAEHLIVRAILLDHIDYVLEHGRLAQFHRDGRRADV